MKRLAGQRAAVGLTVSTRRAGNIWSALLRPCGLPLPPLDFMLLITRAMSRATSRISLFPEAARGDAGLPKRMPLGFKRRIVSNGMRSYLQ